MNIAGYQIFINLLVKHIKTNYIEYRQFILVSQNSYFVHNFFLTL